MWHEIFDYGWRISFALGGLMTFEAGGIVIRSAFDSRPYHDFMSKNDISNTTIKDRATLLYCGAGVCAFGFLFIIPLLLKCDIL